MAHGPVLTRRQLNRALLGRQMLLRRESRGVTEAVEWLVGLQGQTPQSPYLALWSRLDHFDPTELSALIESRDMVRIGLLRTTIHLVTTRDALALRPVLQSALTRSWGSSQFPRRLGGADLQEVLRESRRLLEEEPLGPADLGRLLVKRWPEGDPSSLAYASRFLLPLVQVPPRGLWQRTSATRHTTLEAWTGRPMAQETRADDLILRYLAAFGPATVGDMRIWSWLTGLREVVDRLRPRLREFRDEAGRQLLDVADGLLPDPDTPAPARFLPDYDNLVLSHEDRARVVPKDVPQNVIWDWGALLVDGFTAGTWKVGRAKSAATLRAATLRKLTPAEAADVQEEGHRLLAFWAPDSTDRDVQITARS